MGPTVDCGCCDRCTRTAFEAGGCQKFSGNLAFLGFKAVGGERGVPKSAENRAVSAQGFARLET